ncbi:MAG: hypothetical protein U0Q15_15800 [Kineosporiaceae bacterium]
MCGIAGLHLRDADLQPRLGELLSAMLVQLGERGPDSAGVGVYGDDTLSPPGEVTVSLLSEAPAAALEEALAPRLPGARVLEVGPVRLLSVAAEGPAVLRTVREELGPKASVIGTGRGLAVLKGVGGAREISDMFDLPARRGYQAVGHTRMATESAVTLAHGHPFSVREDLCLVHNGSFANHDSVRRRLAAEGITCDTDNDSEVGARFLGWRLDCGDDLDKALRRLCETFEGFFTLLVTTANEFAVVRDAIACKPAVIATTPGWVAMASEYRALAQLPGIEEAEIFEPEPEEVHLWERR